MRRSRARSTCREYRVILFADLPKITAVGPRGGISTRAATDDELMQMGIHVFDRGAHRVQALCGGYWDYDAQCGVNAAGDPWPGELIAGRRGLYRVKRQELIEASLVGYEDGQSGGRTRLMTNKRPEEFDQGTGKNRTAAITLTESERLERALPSIFGDG